MCYCVYELKDKYGLYYIGKSENIQARLTNHTSHITNKSGKCRSALLDINFKHKIIEKYENEGDMVIGEQKWYDIYKKKHGDKCVNKQRPTGLVYGDIQKYRQEYKEYIQKDKYIEEQTSIIICECGGKYQKRNKSQHETYTIRHKNYIALRENTKKEITK